MSNCFSRILFIAKRECRRLIANPVYVLGMVVFPILVTVLFTSLMDEGQPEEMPVGVVDLDNTSFTRKLTRSLDAFQTTHIVARYPNVEEARKAMQQGTIYAFLYYPKGTTDALLSSRQPTISFYYSYTSLTAGSLLFRDLKTISTLGSAAVGSATLKAKGLTDAQIGTFLQPIKIDLHTVANPWVNYNVYLSTMLVPGCLLLFVFLITAYAFGMELKQNTSRQLIKIAGGKCWVAIAGKALPHLLVHLAIFSLYLLYIYKVLHFPHEGGVGVIALLAVLSVMGSMGFAIFMFGLFPQLRMSMSMCSLWGVLSYSMVGTAFPTFAMDAPLEVLSNLFPLRHYFRIYQTCVFNGNALIYDWPNILALVVFALLPLLVARSIRKAYSTYVYLP